MTRNTRIEPLSCDGVATVLPGATANRLARSGFFRRTPVILLLVAISGTLASCGGAMPRLNREVLGVKWGDSLERVQSLYPAGTLAQDGSWGIDATDEDPLALGDYPLASAGFLFSDSGMATVLLLLREEADFDACREAFLSRHSGMEQVRTTHEGETCETDHFVSPPLYVMFTRRPGTVVVRNMELDD